MDDQQNLKKRGHEEGGHLGKTLVQGTEIAKPPQQEARVTGEE